MLAVHTILHPTDFSDQSRYAFGLACSLTRDYGARLVLLHVASTPIIGYGEGVIPPDPEELRNEARAQLDALQPPAGDVRAERRVAEGNPVDEIIRVAEEIDASLIVMGTHGRSGLGRLLMGSVAEYVLRRAPCPVLTLKAPFPNEKSEADLVASGSAAE